MTQLTIDVPFIIANDGKTLYGTGDEIIQHYYDFHLTMDMIERMERTIRLNQSLNIIY
jgi:hypothetical protein